jgi:serine/threonine protein kinase
VQLLDLFQNSQGLYCLVYERAGIDLHLFLEKHPFPPSRIRVSTAQLLAALGHLHGMNLLHCDLKPSNILIVAGEASGQGMLAPIVCKLGDLGSVEEVFVGRFRRYVCFFWARRKREPNLRTVGADFRFDLGRECALVVDVLRAGVAELCQIAGGPTILRIESLASSLGLSSTILRG